MSFDPSENGHCRWNPLRSDWVVVCPHRLKRPWNGHIDPPEAAPVVAHDPTCTLCPGSTRAGGVNPPYDGTYVFDNDFPSLLPDAPEGERDVEGIFVARSERGINRVMAWSPRHDLHFSSMPLPAVERVVETWCEQSRDLGAAPSVEHVTIFENRGVMMGASNLHPHGQIWGCQHPSNEAAREQASLEAYRDERGACLLCRTAELEGREGTRVVGENEGFIAVVPYWAAWPFETLLLPKQHVRRLTDLDAAGRNAFARLLAALMTRCDGLFNTPFPYTMGIHQAPFDGRAHDAWHMHAHIYPPLLRSATIRKFMVGFEMLGSPARDMTPESAAERMRLIPDRHVPRDDETPVPTRRP